MRLALLMMLSGCLAHVEVGPGKPLTRLPTGVAWCSAGPRPVQTPPQRNGQPQGLITAKIVQACNRVLVAHDQNLVDFSWQGSISFGLSSDEHGQLTEVCVWGGNFGNTTDYVGCVVESVKRSGIVVPKNLSKEEWILTYVMD